MRYIIAGGTGFIGQALVARWLSTGHDIAVIGRDTAKIKQLYGQRVHAVEWAHLQAVDLLDTDILINLAGASISDKRWTKKRQQEIIHSRVLATNTLATLCSQLGTAAPRLFNASAIGIYGLQVTKEYGLPTPYTENSPIDFNSAPDFLAKVARAWENALQPAKVAGVPVTIMRFAVVLANHGGALPKILMPFYFGLGGKIGSGQQPFSWITLNDLCRSIDVLIAQQATGTFNLVAPGCVTQHELAKAIAQTLHRPCLMPTPGWLLKLIFGNMADELLLRGQHVQSEKLINLGFHFDQPDIASALQKIIERPKS